MKREGGSNKKTGRTKKAYEKQIQLRKKNRETTPHPHQNSGAGRNFALSTTETPGNVARKKSLGKTSSGGAARGKLMRGGWAEKNFGW